MKRLAFSAVATVTLLLVLALRVAGASVEPPPTAAQLSAPDVTETFVVYRNGLKVGDLKVTLGEFTSEFTRSATFSGTQYNGGTAIRTGSGTATVTVREGGEMAKLDTGSLDPPPPGTSITLPAGYTVQRPFEGSETWVGTATVVVNGLPLSVPFTMYRPTPTTGIVNISF